MIVKHGTAIKSPTSPNSPPNKVIANNTQKDGSPVACFCIAGVTKLPSICCKTTINNTNVIALTGEIIHIRRADGIVPIYGPKYGIKSVNPTKVAIKSAYGYLQISKNKSVQVNTNPNESHILPIIN